MRYVVAHVLHDSEGDAIELLRQEIASVFSVQAALAFPPHLTLLASFEVDEIRPFETALPRLANDHATFSLNVIGFNAFRQAVWFVDVEQAQELLALRRCIIEAVKQTLGVDDPHAGLETHFHITLAYKDLSEEAFRGIGVFLKKRRVPVQKITIDAISILRYRTGHWDVCATFPLRG